MMCPAKKRLNQSRCRLRSPWKDNAEKKNFVRTIEVTCRGLVVIRCYVVTTRCYLVGTRWIFFCMIVRSLSVVTRCYLVLSCCRVHYFLSVADPGGMSLRGLRVEVCYHRLPYDNSDFKSCIKLAQINFVFYFKKFLWRNKKLRYRRETRTTLCISWNIGLLLYEQRKQEEHFQQLPRFRYLHSLLVLVHASLH